MNLQKEFERAVEEKGYRPRFVALAKKEVGTPKYVSRVIYDPHPHRNDVLMQTAPNPAAALLIKGTRSNIEVFPASFNSDIGPNNADDFLSLLADHEYFHAREIYEDPKTVIRPIWNTIRLREAPGLKKAMEIRAYDNQISNFRNHSCSLKFQLCIAAKRAELDPETAPILTFSIK
jgi:hypothetical protein